MKNRTNTYLAQSLLQYDIDEPELQLNKRYKKIKSGVIGFFIGHKHLSIDDVLYIVLDSLKIKDFNIALEHFKEHPSYKNDYAIGEIYGSFHILELKIHSKFGGIIQKFVKGEYSKLYESISLDTLSKFFCDNKFALQVLTKSPILRRKIEDELDTIIPTSLELDDIPKLENEIYEYVQTN